MDESVAVTVMRVLLFVLQCVSAERVWRCEVDGNAGVGVGCGECRACGWYTWYRYCV